MIHRLIEFSLKNRFLILLVYALLAVWRHWALLRTPIDAIPDLSENQVIVYTDWAGRKPAGSRRSDHVSPHRQPARAGRS